MWVIGINSERTTGVKLSSDQVRTDYYWLRV